MKKSYPTPYEKASSNQEAYEREYFYSLRVEDYSKEFEKIALLNGFDNSDKLLDYLFEKMQNGELENAITEIFEKELKTKRRREKQLNGVKVTIKIYKFSFKDKGKKLLKKLSVKKKGKKPHNK